jgi:hypothetical protein
MTIRTTILLSVPLGTASEMTFPQAQGDPSNSTIYIDRTGPMDRYIPPIVISASDIGIARGRSRILGGNELPFVEALLVDEATMKQLTALVLATAPDDASQARSWGAVQFTVLFRSSERAVILGKAHAIALLESLSAATNDAGLRSDLKDLLDYERSLRRFSALAPDLLVGDRHPHTYRGPSGPKTTNPSGASAPE